MSNSNINRAIDLLDEAIDPSTDTDQDPWLQVEKAKDILEKESNK